GAADRRAGPRAKSRRWFDLTPYGSRHVCQRRLHIRRSPAHRDRRPRNAHRRDAARRVASGPASNPTLSQLRHRPPRRFHPDLRPMKPAAYVLAALFLLPATSAFGQYPWPIEPFHESHEITGMFMEYRSTAPAPHFHDGTDIPKPDFSPVYSVVDGRVRGIGGDWVRVEKNSVESYAYVHIDPSPGLSVGDSAKALHTVLGTIQSGQGHVHFKDGRPNVGRQAPRADGGLTPFTDNWAPKIENVRFYSLPNRSRLDAASPGQPDTLVGHVQITFRVREPGG